MLLQKLSVILFLLFIFFNIIDCSPKKKNTGRKLSRSHFEFSLELYREIVRLQSEENLVFSPYSINAVLAMLFLGTSSASNSSKQLRSALHFDSISYVDVHKAFKDIVHMFEETYYREKLKSANGLFVQEGVHVSPHYERALREFYLAKLETIDFGNADESRDVINDWIDEVTNGQIHQFLDIPPSSNSKMMLVNAVSLDSEWLFPFNPINTFEKGLFFLPGNMRLEVPMMSGKQELPLGYSPELECRILELPFSQRRISFFILLPDDPEIGIFQLERNMTSENIKRLFGTLQDKTVNVRLPRFRITSNVEVDEALKNLGIIDIFDENKSDLSLITPEERLYLTSIAHKAVFEVTEKGARGSSATAVTVQRMGSLGEKYFEVDHPFLFLIWDYYSGMLLLMGRVLQPDVILK